MNKSFIAIILAGALAISCSSKPEVFETVLKGNITVADSVDSSGDYSGIGVIIIDTETAANSPDTLLNVTTDPSGAFEGKVTFPQKRVYRVGFSRNGELIGSTGAILAEDDTLFISAELPGLGETLTLTSREHKAMETYNRVERGFQRVAAFIQAGAVADSLIPYELDKWHNLYWEVYEKHNGTVASFLAAEKSAGILSGLNQSLMLRRIDAALPDDYMIPVAVRLAKPYIAATKGFDAADNYLDSLAELTENEKLKELILRDKIEMYFDSSRIQQAKELLVDYEKEFKENSNSQNWAKRIRYDLNYLAPGVQAPEFEFISLDGDSVSREKMMGEVYILEISPLASAEYQNDLDRTIVIHEIYKNYGLKILTIPLDENEVTVDAFFEERRKLWPVAKVGTFDAERIIKKFNITQVPTRLLIDENGVVIRKYVRGEFQDVIEGLNKAFNSNSPS